MKRLIFYTLMLTINITFGQSKPTPRPMAKPGDEVWVVGYHVQANKRAQYERFVHEVFWGGAAKLPNEGKQVFRQTRILHPTKANADGSYTYLFIMDPVIKKADYGIKSLLTKMYGKSKAAEYFKLFTGALVPGSKYDEFIVKQSND